MVYVQGTLDMFGFCMYFKTNLYAALQELNPIYHVLVLSFCCPCPAGGGLYSEAGAAFLSMNDAGISADVSTFNFMIEAYGRGGLFDDAVEVERDMEDARCPSNKQTYEALLGVYCTAGMFDEAKAQFLDMKIGAGVPSVDSYCLMLSVCARRNR